MGVRFGKSKRKAGGGLAVPAVLAIGVSRGLRTLEEGVH